MRVGAASRGSGPAQKRRVSFLPTTQQGRWAAWLGLAAVLLVAGWRLLPGAAVLGFACGLAAGPMAFVAIFRHGERAIAVFAALLPSLFVVAFILAELIVGHQ